MRWFRFAVLVILAALLQSGLLANWRIKPDLLLIVLVFCSVYYNTSEAIITSFTIGFAADIIGPTMGPKMISFGLFGSALAYLQRLVAIRKMPYQALAILVVGLLAGALAYFLTFLKNRVSMPEVYKVVLWTALSSSIVGPFLFLPAAWWMRTGLHRFRRG